MRFELIGKTKATLADVDIQSLKMGQTDLKPAFALTFKARLRNDALNMLDASLLTFLYKKAGAEGAKQKTLDGVDVVSELPELTGAGIKIGPINWDDEQTGCTLQIYHGVNDKKPAFTLRDGTVNKLKVTRHEGGTCDFDFRFYTAADIDADVMGEVGVLKSHELDIELTVPEAISKKQGTIGEEEPPLTPQKALAGALQQHADGKVVTIKPPPRRPAAKKSLAAKVGRTAAKKTAGNSSKRR